MAVFGPIWAAGGGLNEVRTGNLGSTRPLGHTVRVIDWNIERGGRLDRIALTLGKLAPDIAVLQEVDLNARRTGRRNIAEDLARATGMNYVYAPAFQELGQGSLENAAYLGQAILTSLPVRSSRLLRFGRQTHFWKPYRMVPRWAILQRRLGGRIALVVELGEDSTRLVVYNLHLESRGFGVTRMAQLLEVLADARQYPPEVPVILAGDLNTKYRPDLFESRAKQEGFHNCFDRHVRTHVLFGSLDWIFVRGRAACENTRVVRGSKASDHDPIVAQIELY